MKKQTKLSVKTVGVRMPGWMVASLLKIARREQCGLSRLVRLAVIRQYVDEMERAADED